MHPSATETFIGNMRGPVVRPMDADYDTVRSLYNGMIDKCPMMIARCTDVADVVAAVNFARQNDLRVAIRGGGHNVAGRALTDGGVMIDLAEMKGIAIDPVQATATAEGGVVWGELNDAAARQGWR